MISQTAFPGIEYYAREDQSRIADEASETWGLDVKELGMDISQDIVVEGEESVYHIVLHYQIEGTDFDVPYNCYDRADSDYDFEEITKFDLHDAYMHAYYMTMNQPHDAAAFASTRIQGQSITAAAEDDPFADMGFDEPTDGPAPEMSMSVDDNDTVEESLDDMTDTLDRLNEYLKDFDEDDVNIEIDNNITDHYIAECEKCHGVFITSVQVSDQAIEKISGTCPLCDEDCDQYLKWTIQEV